MPMLANAGETKMIFEVKCSNNSDYRLKPVFGFVDPAGSAPVEITHMSRAPKEHKLVIQWAVVPADATDAQTAFPSISADQLQSLTVNIVFSCI
ncbi:unnamed protein product [Angiostrongylus costaricensis]|uniref:MSP domain-containing protein n=1 Tax=Angiostrongylus costaricensis TaxID=334426 RepID=A0A0R3PPD7_ANGCS|nr:unnamed protein product [Angiostrongylus costaricensis]